MTLTLTIGNVPLLDNGMPSELVLHRRGAVIGRSATSDWSLPDPRSYISSRHLEVRFDGRNYVVTDTSTNGTYLNGARERMSEPRRVEQGDRFQVGHYEIVAALSGDAGVVADQGGAAPASEWRGWDDSAAGPAAADAAAADGWQPGPPRSPASPSGSGWAAAPAPSGSGWQPQVGPSLAAPEPHRAFGPATAATSPAPSSGWAPSARAPDLPVASTWAAATPAPDPASAWSSAAPDRPPAPTPDDVWGKLAEGNVIDWARGGFGQPVAPPTDPLGLAPPPARESLPATAPRMAQAAAADGWGQPASVPAAAASAAAPVPAPATAAATGGNGGERFAAAIGLRPDQLADQSSALLDRAGSLFRRLVAGLVVMVEARARAKAQLGAEATAFNPEGNNPIKFARTPDEALAMLLGEPQPGFMGAERAVEDAFLELQSHQMATLRAMQGALRATLDRFSPAAIRARADARGVLERIVPAARDAALWQAYEREFGGVAQGSDEAFMDVFAREFRQAYNAQARR